MIFKSVPFKLCLGGGSAVEKSSSKKHRSKTWSESWLQKSPAQAKFERGPSRHVQKLTLNPKIVPKLGSSTKVFGVPNTGWLYDVKNLLSDERH